MARVQKQTIATRLRAQYAAHMPAKRRHRVILWVAFFVAATVIAAQLAYPADRGLPMASVAGRSVGLATHEEMAKVVTEAFAATKVKLTVAGKTAEYPLKSAGAEPNAEEMIKRLSNYPLWFRLVPGSALWPVQANDADVFFTAGKLEKFTAAQAKVFSAKPQNARLAIKNGELVATSETPGRQVRGSDLAKVLSSAQYHLGGITTLAVPAKQLPPARRSEDLAKVRGQAEAALAHTVTILADGKKFTPGKAKLASWIVLGTAKDGKVTLSVDQEKIREYLDEVNKKVGRPAGQTNIQIVDGREAGRTPGQVGRAINYEVVTPQIAKALLAPPRNVTIVAPMADVQPSVIFNSRYTTTQAGLQAYVNDVANARGMHIVIQQLDGERWRAAAREHESIPAASTFKLFLAMVLFDKINRGEIHWNDPMLDTDVAGCFDRMTVASTNPCAESWIAQFGRPYINNFVYARGFSTGTSFDTGWATVTTAADLNKFMMGLNDGTLVSGANRDLLLYNLSRHPYRYGIPTGSAGQVNDKVGFLWDYVHDTAIVHHPRGTYVMTIMTKGQSYAAIAGVTREVERIMYP